MAGSAHAVDGHRGYSIANVLCGCVSSRVLLTNHMINHCRPAECTCRLAHGHRGLSRVSNVSRAFASVSCMSEGSSGGASMWTARSRQKTYGCDRTTTGLHTQLF